MKTKEEIIVNQIAIPIYYIINNDGSKTYDFEQMTEEFENELSKLAEKFSPPV